MDKHEIILNHEGEQITLYPYEHHAKYYETDQMGIIHHSNYVKWMEEARMNLMDQMGLSYKQMGEMEYVMYDKKTGERKATAKSSHCFLNRSNGHPISLKRVYPELDTKFFEFKESSN